MVLDADKMAHDSYRPYTNVWKSIVKAFGEGILSKNDNIDRQKLGKIVFNAKDPESANQALATLNKIIHPYLKRKIRDKIHRHFRRQTNIVVVAALWKEVGIPDYCEKTLLIRANPEQCAQRIQGRDSISAETYQMRIQNQTEPENPDFVIENTASKEEFKAKLSELLLEIES